MQACAACGAENPDGFLHCGYCAAALTAPVVGQRRLATLLFCDVSGSTAMGERVDAESVQELMQLYFREMRAALEAHGGTVEKFIGDAVVAVFGVPEVHEDDALRACRAAVEMQERLAVLNGDLERRFGVRIAVRIGLNSGEVVSSRETIVTGDPANVAARLQQAAEPGEVLLGETTYRLVRGAVSVEAVYPLAAKGKSEPIQAYRLLEVAPTGPLPRPAGALFVGRDAELVLLERELDAAATERRCRLVTVIGEPGVGKSRLAAELIARVGAGTRVVRGTCLSYGEGIAYWAVCEIVRQLAGIHDDHSPKEARAQIEAHVAAEPHGPAVASIVALLLGLGDGASTPPETAWAIRRFIAAQAADGPLLVLVDDIHWAEPALLDLLAGLPAGISVAPILVLCLSRGELLEHRPDWEVAVRLEPLGVNDVDTYLQSLLGDAPAAARAQLAQVSAGNPLFAEELVAMLLDEGVLRVENGSTRLVGELSSVVLPPSLQALLNSRLDRLHVQARGALERGAIEGELFHRGAVVELSDEDSRSQVPGRLEELAGKDMIRPAAAGFAGEVAFRFKHILVREATYKATAKKVRAALHERFARWLERFAGERVTEYEEILGYHLEQAYRFRIELGPADETTQALAARAAELLAAAGRRARDRGEGASAAALLRRAAELHPPARPALLPLIGEQLVWLGKFPQAAKVLDEAAETARARGDEASEAVASLMQAFVGQHTGDPTASLGRVHALAEAAADTLLAGSGDDAQLALVLSVGATCQGWLGHSRDAADVFERALEHARRCGDLYRARGCLEGMIGSRGWGPAPVSEGIAFLEQMPGELRSMLGRSRVPYMHTALMDSYSGRFADARREYAEARLIAEELGLVLEEAAMTIVPGMIELLAENPARAELELRGGYDRLGELGAQGFRSTIATWLAEALVRQGRDSEAAEILDVADAAAQLDDLDPQIRSRSVRARILAHRGELDRAEELGREAVGLASGTDYTVLHGDALLSLAEVLRLAGADDESDATLRQALELFERKENVVQAEQTRALLKDLEEQLGGEKS